MRPNSNALLVISQSGRALAASAARAGYAVHVLDLFADEDTRAIAASCRVVQTSAGVMDSQHVRNLLQDYVNMPLAGVIVGSGLEGADSLLADLQEQMPFFGNAAPVWQLCHDPQAFAAILQDLLILQPLTRTTAPANKAAWLSKQKYSAGGAHVHFLADNPSVTPALYYQEYLEGRHLSAVFLADGRDCVLVGASETDVVDRDGGDFRYAGAVSSVNIATAVAGTLRHIITGLTGRLGLKGLCGIDVVIDDQGQCRLLELNPRPTATFELLEQDTSLVAAHISACQGQLPVLPPVTVCRGHRVYYCDRDLRMPELKWPRWASDRPLPGQLLHAGEPACTVHAEGSDRAAVRHKLLERTAWLQQYFAENHRAA